MNMIPGMGGDMIGKAGEEESTRRLKRCAPIRVHACYTARNLSDEIVMCLQTKGFVCGATQRHFDGVHRWVVVTGARRS